MNTTFVRPVVEGVKTSFLFLWAAVREGGVLSNLLIDFSSTLEMAHVFHRLPVNGGVVLKKL